jgi:hypothetical protein
MTRDDDAVLSADERAQLAVLDAALAERLCGEQPPDLWPALQREPSSMPARRAATPRPWLLAALLLLGLGTIATLLVTRSDAPDATVTAPADDTVSPSGPHTLEELRERLRGAERAMLDARGSWNATRGAWVAWPRHELDAMFRPGLSPNLDRDDLPPLVAALQAAALARVDGAVARDVVWTHRCTIVCGEGRNSDAIGLLMQTGGPQPPRVAFRSPRGAIELDVPTFPFAGLAEPLADVTRATIQGLGLVIGADGFAAVPTGARRLVLLDVPAAAVGELTRFPDLRQVDFTRSPEWHRAAVLQQVPPTLESASLSPVHLTADAYPVLGSWRQLKELFLVHGNTIHVFTGEHDVVPAPGLDDAALLALGGLTQLTELALAGGSFGDDALRHLASLALKSLALIDCARVRGHGLSHLTRVEGLMLLGGDLDRTVLANATLIPGLRGLHLRSATLTDLTFLHRGVKLQELSLHGAVERLQLPLLANCPALTKLSLCLDPPLRDDELPALYGLRHLKALAIESELVTAAGRAALQAALPGVTLKDERW